MNKQQAEHLLNDTFSKEFEVKRFLGFTKELFKSIQLQIKDCSQFIPTEFSDYITKVEKLGQYENNNKVIEILAVKLARESSKERARTMQRNFVAKWLGKFENDAALVAFYDETDDWRFSFVKMEYNLIEDESGKVKAETDLTPAKRYSYLVGKNEPNYTCRSQFFGLILNDEHAPSIDEIELAFSIENVTKEFFNHYKDLFLRLKESLDAIIVRDKYVKEEFEEKNIDTVEFAKKLLGQIVFLYFLQKKGWLGVQKSSDGRFLQWGTGPKNFMRKLFGDQRKGELPLVSYNNFFNDVLEPLFYQALAKKRPNDYYDPFNCKIPFLNGGLFEAINDYDWKETNIFIDNEIFEDIFDIFDEYNFTVKEDEPLEKEVAVDPEMLGKVFENLLDVNDRKSKGAFYTPREIVHYMCQQSLINYLETNSGLPRKDLEKFINLGDFALDQTIKAQEQKKKYQGKTFNIDTRYLLPNSIENNHELLDKLLKEIKVVDPAVGSGAFPVGMMNEIVRARSILSIFHGGERRVYDLKRETIENCLYGVDIMPSAVEICKLRFWLSLIVDEIDISNIKPLPNLDHKIMCGNSLLEEFEGNKLFDDKLLGVVAKDVSPEVNRLTLQIKDLNINIGEIATGKKKGDIEELKKEKSKLERQKVKLTEGQKDTGRNSTLNEMGELKIKQSQIKLSKIKSLQKQFFNEFDNDKKKSLRNEIDNLEWKLVEETLKEQGNDQSLIKLAQYKKNKSKPFFLWKLYFAEIFQRENPGFDVVIGNPPYLEARSPEFTEELKTGLQNFVKNEFLEDGNLIQKGSDLLIYFYLRSLLAVRKDGIISFITQNSWLDTDYGKRFQEFILNHTQIKAIVDSDYKQFDTANINTVITFFIGNSRDKQNLEILFLRCHNSFDKIQYSFSKIDKGEHSEKDLSVKSFKSNELHKMNLKWGLLLYSDQVLLDILQILKKSGKRLENIEEVSVYCGQGLNLTKDYLVNKKNQNKFSEKILLPIMTSKEGAPFELKKTYYCLIDDAFANKEESSIIKENKINTFNRKKTSKQPPTLILPRGVSRHYCTFNSNCAYSSSAVDIYINETNKKISNLVAKRLWIFLNSSLAWLIREISGRKNLGGGMLKAEATDLKQFEIYFEFEEQTCERIFKKFRNREASKTINELTDKDHIELDEFVFDYLKLSKIHKDYILEKLRNILKNREDKATSR